MYFSSCDKTRHEAEEERVNAGLHCGERARAYIQTHTLKSQLRRAHSHDQPKYRTSISEWADTFSLLDGRDALYISANTMQPASQSVN